MSNLSVGAEMVYNCLDNERLLLWEDSNVANLYFLSIWYHIEDFFFWLGCFTEPQRKLYNATLHVQEECIKLCTQAHSLDEIFTHMLHLLAEELLVLGIIPPETPLAQQINVSLKYLIID